MLLENTWFWWSREQTCSWASRSQATLLRGSVFVLRQEGEQLQEIFAYWVYQYTWSSCSLLAVVPGEEQAETHWINHAEWLFTLAYLIPPSVYLLNFNDVTQLKSEDLFFCLNMCKVKAFFAKCIRWPWWKALIIISTSYAITVEKW